EVVEDDLFVVEALLRVAVGAVLAQPHAVSPAVAGDDERRARRGDWLRGSGRLCRDDGEEEEDGDECERSTHRPENPARTRSRLPKGLRGSTFPYGTLI